jgi:hypothetical protein
MNGFHFCFFFLLSLLTTLLLSRWWDSENCTRMLRQNLTEVGGGGGGFRNQCCPKHKNTLNLCFITGHMRESEIDHGIAERDSVTRFFASGFFMNHLPPSP